MGEDNFATSGNNGVIGTDGFLLTTSTFRGAGPDTGYNWAFWLFQWAFAATTATSESLLSTVCMLVGLKYKLDTYPMLVLLEQETEDVRNSRDLRKGMANQHLRIKQWMLQNPFDMSVWAWGYDYRRVLGFIIAVYGMPSISYRAYMFHCFSYRALYSCRTGIHNNDIFPVQSVFLFCAHLQTFTPRTNTNEFDEYSGNPFVE